MFQQPDNQTDNHEVKPSFDPLAVEHNLNNDEELGAYNMQRALVEFNGIAIGANLNTGAEAAVHVPDIPQAEAAPAVPEVPSNVVSMTDFMAEKAVARSDADDARELINQLHTEMTTQSSQPTVAPTSLNPQTPQAQVIQFPTQNFPQGGYDEKISA